METMNEGLLQNWGAIIAAVYGGGFLFFGALELFRPRRPWSEPTAIRWLNNTGIFVVSATLLYAAFPFLIIPFSLVVQQRDWGLLNHFDISGASITLISIVIVDFFRYIEHRLLHDVPLLWRLHRMHHADPDFDVTTTLRAHPLEVVFSTSFRMMIIAVFGLPVVAVVLAELIIIATNLFIHANMRLPLAVERWLRLLIVTPDFHRVHHSTMMQDNRSNFANILSSWDYLFSTYKEEPVGGHEGMHIGLNEFRDPKHMLMHWMIINPVLGSDKCPQHAVETAETA
jgi:sterol desaturase/sphingolipid hydroxylase (fatty acid hydroxylase superfamily)